MLVMLELLVQWLFRNLLYTPWKSACDLRIICIQLQACRIRGYQDTGRTAEFIVFEQDCWHKEPVLRLGQQVDLVMVDLPQRPSSFFAIATKCSCLLYCFLLGRRERQG